MSVIEKIKAMSGKEIVMTMVQALREPMIKIDMRTFGSIQVTAEGKTICFGCAATAFLCRVAGNTDYVNNTKQGPDYDDYYGALPLLSEDEIKLDRSNCLGFIDEFESAVDYLRQGRINEYNFTADRQGFAILTANDTTHWCLPELKNDYKEEDLKLYEDFADYQG